jgi:hypothetical protein
LEEAIPNPELVCVVHKARRSDEIDFVDRDDGSALWCDGHLV